jgi:hypothetical protein
LKFNNQYFINKLKPIQMKKVFIYAHLMLLFLITTQTFAQIKFGVKAGLNLSNMLAKDNDQTYSENFKMKPGFHAGATVEFPIVKRFSFETGLLFATKGTKINEKETVGNETNELKGEINLYYLDIPLTAKVTFDIGSAKIYGDFGLYLGIGLKGKSKIEITDMGGTDSFNENIKFGSGSDQVKRVDYGLTAGVGVEIQSVQFGISYGYGLANLSNDTDNGTITKNRVLGISVGYKFGGSPKSNS